MKGKLSKIVLACAGALLAGAIFCSRENVKPLNTSIGLGSKLENTRILDHFPSVKGIIFSTYDREKERWVFFYDYGFNGTLDEIGMRGHNQETYFTYNPSEIKEWELDYKRVRESLSGNKFEPTIPNWHVFF